MDTAYRVMLLPSLRELVKEVRSERARMPLESNERKFYLGVEAATGGFLHPEILPMRTEDWLTQQDAPFRDGYVAMLAEITAVVASGKVPIRLVLPEPPGRFAGAGGEDT